MGMPNEQSSNEESPEGEEMISAIATAVLAIGACLYYGARVVLSIRDAGGDLRGLAKKRSWRVLKMHKK